MKNERETKMGLMQEEEDDDVDDDENWNFSFSLCDSKPWSQVNVKCDSFFFEENKK